MREVVAPSAAAGCIVGGGCTIGCSSISSASSTALEMAFFTPRASAAGSAAGGMAGRTSVAFSHLHAPQLLSVSRRDSSSIVVLQPADSLMRLPGTFCSALCKRANEIRPHSARWRRQASLAGSLNRPRFTWRSGSLGSSSCSAAAVRAFCSAVAATSRPRCSGPSSWRARQP